MLEEGGVPPGKKSQKADEEARTPPRGSLCGDSGHRFQDQQSLQSTLASGSALWGERHCLGCGRQRGVASLARARFLRQLACCPEVPGTALRDLNPAMHLEGHKDEFDVDNATDWY